MLLHIVTDEKFIDSAWKAFERVAPQQNLFKVLDGPSELRYIHAFHPERITLTKALNSQFLSALRDYDVVFLHSLNNAARLIVDSAPNDVTFVWIGFGYDYYHLINEERDRLLPFTLDLVKTFETPIGPLHKRRLLPFHELRKLAKRPLAYFTQLKRARRLRRIGANAPAELILISKISFFAPVLDTEYSLIKEKHPDFSPTYISWNYGLELLSASADRPIANDIREPRFVIGNSASAEGNHLDVFAWITEIGFGGEIVCPLSYGDRRYAEQISEAGRLTFGNRFRTISQFLSFDDYMSLIASSTHLIMGHRRQQGLGNIIIAAYTGTTIVLRRENPLYAFLLNIGIEVECFDDNLIRTELIVQKDTISKHRKILKEIFGEDVQMERTRQLISACSSAHDKH